MSPQILFHSVWRLNNSNLVAAGALMQRISKLTKLLKYPLENWPFIIVSKTVFR